MRLSKQVNFLRMKRRGEERRGEERRVPVQYSTVQYSTVQYSTVQYDVKNVTEERRGGEGRGPARVWGSDVIFLVGLEIVLKASPINILFK